MVVDVKEITTVASNILEETRQLGELSEREILILQTGFHKLMRGLTPRAADFCPVCKNSGLDPIPFTNGDPCQSCQGKSR